MNVFSFYTFLKTQMPHCQTQAYDCGRGKTRLGGQRPRLGGGNCPPPLPHAGYGTGKRRYFSFRLASLNRNCVQYYNNTSVLYSVHYENCNVRVSLQIQYEYVQMFLLSLYVRYTYCTTYAVMQYQFVYLRV